MSYKVPVLPKPNQFVAEIRCQTAMTSCTYCPDLFFPLDHKACRKLKKMCLFSIFGSIPLAINISVLTKCAILIFAHFMTEPYIEQSELNLDSI